MVTLSTQSSSPSLLTAVWVVWSEPLFTYFTTYLTHEVEWRHLHVDMGFHGAEEEGIVRDTPAAVQPLLVF